MGVIDNAETANTQASHKEEEPNNMDIIKQYEKRFKDLQDENNQQTLELQNKTNQFNTKLQELQANNYHQNTLLQQKTNKLSEQDEIILQLTKRLQDFTIDIDRQNKDILHLSKENKVMKATLESKEEKLTVLEDCKSRIKHLEN